jgi:hypothetical protein
MASSFFGNDAKKWDSPHLTFGGQVLYFSVLHGGGGTKHVPGS